MAGNGNSGGHNTLSAIEAWQRGVKRLPEGGAKGRRRDLQWAYRDTLKQLKRLTEHPLYAESAKMQAEVRRQKALLIQLAFAVRRMERDIAPPPADDPFARFRNQNQGTPA
jgi:hypothetical protein